MWERSPYCLVFDGAEMNKHNITVGSSCAKDGTWTWAHLPNNIWKRIIGFQSQVSISHSFISVTNREQVLPPLYSSPSFHHPSCCSLNFAYFLWTVYYLILHVITNRDHHEVNSAHSCHEALHLWPISLRFHLKRRQWWLLLYSCTASCLLYSPNTQPNNTATACICVSQIPLKG